MAELSTIGYAWVVERMRGPEVRFSEKRPDRSAKPLVLKEEAAQRIAELEAIVAKLQDPALVHAAMLRGEIAKPGIREMLHAHGEEALRRWDALAEAERIAELEKALEDYRCAFGQGLLAHGIPLTPQQQEAERSALAAMQKEGTA